MSQLLRDIKKATESMICNVHNAKAEIKVNGDKITFEACCESFKEKITKKAKEAVTTSAKNQIKNAFKDF